MVKIDSDIDSALSDEENDSSSIEDDEEEYDEDDKYELTKENIEKNLETVVANNNSDNESNKDNDNDEDVLSDISKNDYDEDSYHNVTKFINTLNNDSDIKTFASKNYITGEDRITKNILSKYEFVRIIGERTKQLVMGAKPLVSTKSTMTHKEIALMELKNKKLPFKIVRQLPNEKYELWLVEELEIKYLININ